MDWEWDSSSHKRIQTGKTGIKKLKDEWIWQTVKLGPAGQYGSHQIGELLEDEVYPCGFCNGTGEKPRGSKCSVCKGKGSVSVEPLAVKCAYCKGGGQEKPRSNVTCNACRGKGVIHVEEPVQICPHCQGTGKEPTNKLVCIKCRGKGVVTVKEEEEETWDTEKATEQSEGVPPSDSEGGKERVVSSASGSEREALQVIKELGQADEFAVAGDMSPPVSSAYAKQLCDALAKKGLILRHSRLYRLSPHGEKVLE
ncbi:MAG: hypothetical protein L6246_10100 [Thermodesulfovibrionales bacterium]|nr:hypothetical protein [Thermodesulfovibrionales bacterium]